MIHRRDYMLLLGALLLGTSAQFASAADRPDVVLIICDDLNDWIQPLGGHPQTRTPAMAEFAESAVNFTNAHSNNPVCAPSRASFLTGIYPHTSGNLFWNKWHENPVLSNSKTIMEHFRANGYTVVGSGKLMHHFQRGQWDEFPNRADYGPLVWDGSDRVAHPGVAAPFSSIGAIDGSFGSLADVPFADSESLDGAGWIYGGWGTVRPFRYEAADDRDLTPDERVARWAASRLERFADERNQGADEPFLLAVGFIRPHTPLHVPQEFFNLFPIEDVRTSKRLRDDADDTHFEDHFGPEQKGRRYHQLISESYGSAEAGLKRFTQAYLASVAFVDAQIATVLDALEQTGLDENTVVVITSDHGFNVGEKRYLFKNAPWDDSTRVPLLVRAPRVSQQGGVTPSPVSLIDLYPTLVDLCGLAGDTRKNDNGRELDGASLRPFLENPTAKEWEGPAAALTMVHAAEDATRELTADERKDPARQHWSIRTERFRYIRYNSGATELYDHHADPDAWHNIADDPEFADDVARLHGLLQAMVHPVDLEPGPGSAPNPAP